MVKDNQTHFVPITGMSGKYQSDMLQYHFVRLIAVVFCTVSEFHFEIPIFLYSMYMAGHSIFR